jgi:hypothetical protein
MASAPVEKHDYLSIIVYRRSSLCNIGDQHFPDPLLKSPSCNEAIFLVDDEALVVAIAQQLNLSREGFPWSDDQWFEPSSVGCDPSH